MTDLLSDLARRPVIELVELVALVLAAVWVIAHAVFFIIKAFVAGIIKLKRALHVRKVGVGGIEFEPEPRRKAKGK